VGRISWGMLEEKTDAMEVFLGCLRRWMRWVAMFWCHGNVRCCRVVEFGERKFVRLVVRWTSQPVAISCCGRGHLEEAIGGAYIPRPLLSRMAQRDDYGKQLVVWPSGAAFRRRCDVAWGRNDDPEERVANLLHMSLGQID
jgi:hypothetical protein